MKLETLVFRTPWK